MLIVMQRTVYVRTYVNVFFLESCMYVNVVLSSTTHMSLTARVPRHVSNQPNSEKNRHHTIHTRCIVY